jgi:NAD(P)-dependent dehydrogenase (short-subunit alcohol dehydrogenase family)
MLLSPLVDLDLAGFDRMHRTNVRGTFVVDQQAARRVRAGGTIVNFSSSVVKLALPSYAGYAASKGAVEAITMILARELRGRDVTVNAVAPGPTATALFLDGKDQETITRMAPQPPARAPRHPGRHRGGDRLPRRARPLGQRRSPLRQRRHRLMLPGRQRSHGPPHRNRSNHLSATRSTTS